MLIYACHDKDPLIEILEGQILLRNSWLDSVQEISSRNSLMWDSTNFVLQDGLPDGISSEVRNNILQVRNAQLIGMFEIYPNLDIQVKDRITLSGEQDKKDAKEMSHLVQQIDSIEKGIGRNLELIAQKKPELSKKLIGQLRTTDTRSK